MAQQLMRAKASCANHSFRDHGHCGAWVMFRSGGQSVVKSPVFSSQASLVLIYRPPEGMKGEIDLAQPGIWPPDLWCGKTKYYHSATNPDHWSKRDTLKILGRKCDPELFLAIQYYPFLLNFNKGK
ncbi:hypothetical protein TNCV_4554751 [Trichonephila clavipes]|nr:hypothetical protein TNCV_4554751 [Trichonephila clavipes]